MKIHFLDTSVFCNILKIPNMSDDFDIAFSELEDIMKNSKSERIILPFATIIETGNHIAHIPDGNLRYKAANKFSTAIQKTINGDAPWNYYGSQLTQEDLKIICEEFPEAAKIETGIGDLSIIRAYEKFKSETPAIEEIRIWSYDKHLEQYHKLIDPLKRRNKQKNARKF